jgi:pimeloyl-ACP methyl ester carboxylesterase
MTGTSTRLVFNDENFSFELIRAMGHAVYGGADIGECLSTAARIRDGDVESWYREWNRTADRVAAIATACQETGREVSAREAWLRASNYYRSAEFFLVALRPNDPRAHQAARRSRHAFAMAAARFAPPFERISIPYEGTTLSGHLYVVDDSGRPRPTVIVVGGFDSTLEELYFFGPAAALRRGYNALAFDGPGQGDAIRDKQLVFRADYEVPMRAVVDYALTRPEIDPERIALKAVSFGGFLGARAAAFEHRLAALILDPGVWSFAEVVRAKMPGFVWSLHDKGRAWIVDHLVALVVGRSPMKKWALANGLWTFGASSPDDWFSKLAAYTLEGVAENIRCPTLVLDGEADHFQRRDQADRVFAAISAPKQRIVFSASDGGSAHCQMGALSLQHQRVFDWLDGVLVPAHARGDHAPDRAP